MSDNFFCVHYNWSVGQKKRANQWAIYVLGISDLLLEVMTDQYMVNDIHVRMMATYI